MLFVKPKVREQTGRYMVVHTFSHQLCSEMYEKHKSAFTYLVRGVGEAAGGEEEVGFVLSFSCGRWRHQV